MDPMEIVREVSAVPGRAAGTDAERRAHRALARHLRSGRRRAQTETFWIRPGWAWVHAACAVLGIAGSVVSVGHPVTGTALAGAGLVLLVGDLSGRLPLLRRLTPQRATQNVVLPARGEAPVTLVITAAVDAPALGTADRGALARAQARLRARLRGRLPGPAGWALLSLAGVTACGAARIAGADGTLIGAVQLVPSAVLILLSGHFLDSALAQAGPGANADASAVAVAMALHAALEASPPRNLAVELVLAGAGGPQALGMRRHVAARRRAGTRAEDVVVLHLHACGSGTPVWWTREGLVLPLRYHPRLVALAEEVARDEAHLRARPHQSRTASGARAARAAGWPAIAIGCVDEAGVAPRAGEQGDVAGAVEPRAMRGALELALGLVHRLDADLGARSAADVPLRARHERRQGGADAPGARRQRGEAGQEPAVRADPGAG